MLVKIYLDGQKYYPALLLKSGDAIIQDQSDDEAGYLVGWHRFEVVEIYSEPLIDKIKRLLKWK